MNTTYTFSDTIETLDYINKLCPNLWRNNDIQYEQMREVYKTIEELYLKIIMAQAFNTPIIVTVEGQKKRMIKPAAVFKALDKINELILLYAEVNNITEYVYVTTAGKNSIPIKAINAVELWKDFLGEEPTVKEFMHNKYPLYDGITTIRTLLLYEPEKIIPEHLKYLNSLWEDLNNNTTTAEIGNMQIPDVANGSIINALASGGKKLITTFDMENYYTSP